MSKKQIRRCEDCGGPETAHFEPDATWPKGICMCAMPDSPCGCSGFRPETSEDTKKYSPTSAEFKKLERAFLIVLDLARENILEEHQAQESSELKAARKQQLAALDLAEEFVTSQLA